MGLVILSLIGIAALASGILLAWFAACGWSHPSAGEHWMLGYVQELCDFLEAIAHDRQPLSTAELGREGVQVIYAAYQPAEEGRRIDLPGGAREG